MPYIPEVIRPKKTMSILPNSVIVTGLPGINVTQQFDQFDGSISTNLVGTVAIVDN